MLPTYPFSSLFFVQLSSLLAGKISGGSYDVVSRTPIITKHFTNHFTKLGYTAWSLGAIPAHNCCLFFQSGWGEEDRMSGSLDEDQKHVRPVCIWMLRLKSPGQLESEEEWGSFPQAYLHVVGMLWFVPLTQTN